MRLQGTGGFTLLEVITVIAIIGIAAAIALPVLIKTLPQKYLRSTARDLYDRDRKSVV